MRAPHAFFAGIEEPSPDHRVSILPFPDPAWPEEAGRGLQHIEVPLKHLHMALCHASPELGTLLIRPSVLTASSKDALGLPLKAGEI